MLRSQGELVERLQYSCPASLEPPQVETRLRPQKPKCGKEQAEDRRYGRELLERFHVARLLLSAEVGDANTDGIFDDHDLSEADQRATHEDVDVLTRGACH